MRELVTVISCDICKAGDTKTPVADDAPEIRVIFDGRRMRLDVCAEHSNPSWSDIVAYAWPDELPTPIDVSRRTPPPSALTLVCPICDKRAGRNAHGLNVHMSRVHRDVPLEERQRLTGLPVTTRNVNRHATRIGGGGATRTPARSAVSPPSTHTMA